MSCELSLRLLPPHALATTIASRKSSNSRMHTLLRDACACEVAFASVGSQPTLRWGRAVIKRGVKRGVTGWVEANCFFSGLRIVLWAVAWRGLGFEGFSRGRKGGEGLATSAPSRQNAKPAALVSRDSEC